jgi:hypothetical protein
MGVSACFAIVKSLRSGDAVIWLFGYLVICQIIEKANVPFLRRLPFVCAYFFSTK